ncbi:MAG: amidohydrolase family protein [Armatimonadetes bacterium]|nr:amidohydrolase family protein [Armatimonadota bacterium]
MGSAASLLVCNARLVDGTGADPVTPAGLLVEGDRIAWVGAMAAAPAIGPETRVLDAAGRTLMPGLIEAHLHLSYRDVRELPDLDLKCPVEETTIRAVAHARLCLESGYTAAVSAGALHRVDVAMRNAIREGIIPGPRLLAAGRDICSTGGMLDWNGSWLKLGMEGLGIFADGVDECRKAARSVIKEGADIVKVYVTGEGMIFECTAEEVTYTEEEIRVVCEEAHRRGRRVSAHSRGAEGCKISVRAGVDIIDHGTLIDSECVELFAERGVFVVPALNYQIAVLERGPEFGFPREFLDQTLYREELDAAYRNMRRLVDAGVRVLPGGDYGFAWCPHGEYARDLQTFVENIGLTPMQTLVAATKWGSELMRMENEIGTLEAGKLADLLLVDGDPLQDIRILQDRARLSLVMQGGRAVSGPLARELGG